MKVDVPCFSGPSKAWLEMCRVALRAYELELGKYDVSDEAIEKFIREKLSK
jgi:hypothetical protein